MIFKGEMLRFTKACRAWLNGLPLRCNQRKVFYPILFGLLARFDFTQSLARGFVFRGCGTILVSSHILAFDRQCRFVKDLRIEIDRSRNGDDVALVFSTYSNLPLYCVLRSSCMSTDPPMDLITVSYDQKSHSFLKLHGIPSLLLDVSDGTLSDIRYSKTDREKYLLLSLLKQLVIFWTLETKRNVLSLDTDVILLKNFFKLPHIHDYDMTGQGTFCKSRASCRKLCAGIMYYKASNLTSRLALQSVFVIVFESKLHQPAIWRAMDIVGNITVQKLSLDVTPFVNELSGCMGFPSMQNTVAVHFTRHKWGCMRHSKSIAGYKALEAKDKLFHSIRYFSPNIGCPKLNYSAWLPPRSKKTFSLTKSLCLLSKAVFSLDCS